MTDSKYHMYYAAVFAKVAERHAFFYFKEEAQFWTKICILPSGPSLLPTEL
jgi:hypothetical protein